MSDKQAKERQDLIAEDMNQWRWTPQFLLPNPYTPPQDGRYDIYPGFPIFGGPIQIGIKKLAERLAQEKVVVLDGFGGVFWEDLRHRLEADFSERGIQTRWNCVDTALRDSAEIEALVEPFLGGEDPLFGKCYEGQLSDLFDLSKLKALKPDPADELTILYGSGAALAGWSGYLVYVDIPKSEIQYRSRAGSICNLGATRPENPKKMYKRFYYVDWVLLRRHLAQILPELDLIVDGQRPDEPAFAAGGALRLTLKKMSHNYFRARPWFEPGPWGGHWIGKTIPQLTEDVPNYAWSFEFIAPENGLLLADDGLFLEVSSDFLMFQEYKAVMGDFAEEFGYKFPIRFAFLDTFDGGNLSVQCHPHLSYIRQFGETFTQNETYYILDCQPGARVYLGFQENIDPAAFRHQLEHSLQTGEPVDIDRYVNSVPTHKHDLFLIPSGTIHSSGKGNLVLEISQTPYIYTFKMYDWLRLDLNGEPRPLNIERAFDNLDFTRKGKDRINAELVSHPQQIAAGKDWRIIDLPTHPIHFYNIQRLEFSRSIDVETKGSPHVLSLVEGDTVILETRSGMKQLFNYAETFNIPAAAGSYRLTSPESKPIKVVVSFMKPDYKGVE